MLSVEFATRLKFSDERFESFNCPAGSTPEVRVLSEACVAEDVSGIRGRVLLGVGEESADRRTTTGGAVWNSVEWCGVV